MATRKEQILASVDDCLTEYQLWMDDNNIQHIPVGHRFDAAIGAAVALCEAGDIPTDCRKLVDCVSRLAVEYQIYHDGEFVPRTKSPTQRFHSSVEAVAKARGGAEAVPTRKIESVRELRRQGLSDSQIATCYAPSSENLGGKYACIFHDSQGRVLSNLIQQEHDQPGSVIPKDFVHPDELAAQDRASENYAENLTRLTKLREDDTPAAKPFEEADVVAYLREGAFVHQVVHVYGITQQEVLEIATRAGLDIDPKQPGLDKSLDLPQNVAAKLTDEKLRARVFELADGGSTAPEIAKTLRNEFQDPDIKVQRVSQLLLHRAKASESAATGKATAI